VRKEEGRPAGCCRRAAQMAPAMTYSRAASTTIGPGCLTAVFGMGTGVAIRVWSPGVSVVVSTGSGKGCSSRARTRRESGINAVKRLAVSTGPLRQSPALHARPIDLVVFQEPSPLRAGGLVLGWASRLDAFSVYPRRT
jgi:hypothetical protein